MWIIMVLISPVTILFVSSFSRFLLCNFIPFIMFLVLGITSIFGFTLTICVGMFSISGCFTVASDVLTCFVFPPIFSSSSILSYLYPWNGGGSYFSCEYNLLSFHFSFFAFSIFVVICTLPSEKSKALGHLLRFLRQINVISRQMLKSLSKY